MENIRSRAGILILQGEILVDCEPLKGPFSGVVDYGTSLILGGTEIYMNTKEIEVVVIVDSSLLVNANNSLLVGYSGLVKKCNFTHDELGFRGIFFLNPEGRRNQVFNQNWRINYSFQGRKRIVSPDKTGIRLD